MPLYHISLIFSIVENFVHLIIVNTWCAIWNGNNKRVTFMITYIILPLFATNFNLQHYLFSGEQCKESFDFMNCLTFARPNGSLLKQHLNSYVNWLTLSISAIKWISGMLNCDAFSVQILNSCLLCVHQCSRITWQLTVQIVVECSIVVVIWCWCHVVIIIFTAWCSTWEDLTNTFLFHCLWR